MRIVRHPGHRAHGDVGREQEVELADDPLGIGDLGRAVEMRHVIGGVDPRIGATGTGQRDRLAQQDGEPPFDRLLNGRVVGLALPAAVGRTVVFQLQEVAHTGQRYEKIRSFPPQAHTIKSGAAFGLRINSYLCMRKKTDE